MRFFLADAVWPIPGSRPDALAGFVEHHSYGNIRGVRADHSGARIGMDVKVISFWIQQNMMGDARVMGEMRGASVGGDAEFCRLHEINDLGQLQADQRDDAILQKRRRIVLRAANDIDRTVGIGPLQRSDCRVPAITIPDPDMFIADLIFVAAEWADDDAGR